ncbi:sugar-binding protein [Brachybacterium endophyticum]|uniref:Sugar-binding protein n=1 Tax=Brachybacterium endophyticum TaxID=2182385 RepID=A0A2U2RQ03_9MICO|nr:sugar-binding protein [Brachybacterium endophyticum]
MALDAAKLAHGQRLSQQQVADRLHVSRPQVSKLLATAREKGFVRTLVLDPRESDRELVGALRDRFALADVRLVVPAGRGPNDRDHALGVGAAEMISAAGLLEDQVIGLWWSSTIRETAEAAILRMHERPRALVQLGGSEVDGTSPPSLEAFTARAGVPVERSPSPLVHRSLEERLAAEEDPGVRAHETLRRSARVLVFGAELPDPGLLAGSTCASSEECVQVRERSVGRICGRFIDAHGRVVAPTLSQRTGGPTLSELRRARCTVLVAGGEAVTEVIRAALERRYANHLVTDVATARRLADLPTP